MSRPARRLSLLIPPACCLLLTAACTGTGANTVEVSPAETRPARPETTSTTASTTTTTSTTVTTTTTVPDDPVLGSGTAITIGFAGDTYFQSTLRTLLDAGPETALAGQAPMLSAPDLMVLNLETSITERGTAADKEFTFRAPPSALTALRSAGVDVVSMANNHALDFGPDSLTDALAAETASGLPVIGIGANEDEAYSPHIAEIRGQTVAVFAATDVLDSELIDAWTATPTQGGVASAKREDRLLAAVGQARPLVDTLVVFLHWGRELDTCPVADQADLAERLVEAGADIVVGAHSHRLQGAGYMGAAYVAYGLGNFIFYAPSEEAADSGVLTVTATGRRVDGAVWTPATIHGDQLPWVLDEADAAAARSAWEELRGCAGLAAAPEAAPTPRPPLPTLPVEPAGAPTSPATG